jgi:hypothetical protein
LKQAQLKHVATAALHVLPIIEMTLFLRRNRHDRQPLQGGFFTAQE